MNEVRVTVGGSVADDAADFVDAWERIERGKHVETRRTLAFQSWEGMMAVLTGERFRLLKHIHEHPEPSISALARALGRQYSRVHADVAALKKAGLVDRSGGTVKATADRITAEVNL
jgi:predicted transcriptional regulator